VKKKTKTSTVSEKPKRHVFIFMKDGELSLWIKCYIWHKWIPKTPKAYADAMAKVTGQEPDYGPSFWGMYEESPTEKGYKYVGLLDEEAKPIL